ncbi:unnamed protein product, partial [Polarella glacialis]
MLDVKELFTPDRWRLLHSRELSARAPNGLRRGALWTDAPQASKGWEQSYSSSASGPQKSWQHFPDPAGAAVLRGCALRAQELLSACGTSLQDCQREAESSRSLLRRCRSQLE